VAGSIGEVGGPDDHALIVDVIGGAVSTAEAAQGDHLLIRKQERRDDARVRGARPTYHLAEVVQAEALALGAGGSVCECAQIARRGDRAVRGGEERVLRSAGQLRTSRDLTARIDRASDAVQSA
jgi:hypothetical protein